jgi:hypothetical protein
LFSIKLQPRLALHPLMHMMLPCSFLLLAAATPTSHNLPSRFQALLEDAAFAVELLEVEGPAADEGGAIAAQAAAGLQQLEEQLERWQTQRLLSGPYDAQGALLTLTAGAGKPEPI